MAGLLVGLVVVACMGVAVAVNLAAYAQRHWVKRPVVADASGIASPRWNYSVGRLGDVAGFGEQLRESPARYGYADTRRAA